MATKKINELDLLASPVAADLIIVGDVSDNNAARRATITSLITLLGGSFSVTGHSHSNASSGAAGFMTGAQFDKLTGIAANATANSSDAVLLDRANHSGSQSTSTLSDFNANTRAQVEAELAAGSNITITPSGTGASRILTLAATAGTSASDVRAEIEAALIAGTNITITPSGSGATRQLTIASTGGGGGGGGGTRSSSNVTATINSGATSILNITLPKSCLVYSMASDKAARIVLYSSAAAATADASRLITDPPIAGTGVVAESILTVAGTQQLDPVNIAINRETSPSNTYSLSVTNNGASGSITVTLGYLSLEA